MQNKIEPMLTCNHARIINFTNMYVQDKEPKNKLLRGLTLLFHVPLCILEMIELTHETLQDAFKTKKLVIYKPESKRTDILPLSTDAIKDLKELFSEE